MRCRRSQRRARTATTTRPSGTRRRLGATSTRGRRDRTSAHLACSAATQCSSQCAAGAHGCCRCCFSRLQMGAVRRHPLRDALQHLVRRLREAHPQGHTVQCEEKGCGQVFQHQDICVPHEVRMLPAANWCDALPGCPHIPPAISQPLPRMAYSRVYLHVVSLQRR